MITRRFLVASSILLALLSSILAYVVWRLSPSAIELSFISAGFFMMWIVPVIYWVGDRESRGALDDWIQRVGMISMGAVSFIFIFTIFRDLLLATTFLMSRFEWAEQFHLLLRERGAAVVEIGTLAALVSGMWLAQRGPSIVKVDVPIENLSPELSGFKIAQISDLHIGLMIQKDYVRDVVKKTNELNADFVALTGDIIDGDFEPGKIAARELSLLTPKGKIFYAPGNHEYYWDWQKWFPYLAEQGLTVLLNTNEVIRHNGKKILIGGVIDWAAKAFGQGPDLDLASKTSTPADFKILLAHQPPIASAAAKAGFNLQLSGHTHGGQFFPWTYVGKFIHPLYVGLIRIENMWTYVNVGTGSFGPPIRLGRPTEITLLTLKRV